MSFFFLEATAFAKLFVREPGTDALIRLMDSADDVTGPLNVGNPAEFSIRELAESARMVQQPLNPGVLEAARQLLDRTTLRWPEALQLGAALAARDMFPGTRITFVSASHALLEAARAEGLDAIDPARLPAPETALETEAAKEAEAVNDSE